MIRSLFFIPEIREFIQYAVQTIQTYEQLLYVYDVKSHLNRKVYYMFTIYSFKQFQSIDENEYFFASLNGLMAYA